jgi:hypothetical protein
LAALWKFHPCQSMKISKKVSEQGNASGEFVPITPQDVTTASIGAYEGLMLLWVMSPKTMRLKESTQTAAQLFLAGLTIKEI